MATATEESLNKYIAIRIDDETEIPENIEIPVLTLGKNDKLIMRILDASAFQHFIKNKEDILHALMQIREDKTHIFVLPPFLTIHAIIKNEEAV